MKIETTFSCGDLGWVYDADFGDAKQLTIGQVCVQVTDTLKTGNEDSIFDNYRPQAGREESYMCVETGIGSGSVYTLGEHIFATREECLVFNAERIENRNARLAEDQQRKIDEVIAKEAYHRAQLAKIDEYKAARSAV